MDWEFCIWEWYLRLQFHALYRYEFPEPRLVAGTGMVQDDPVWEPYALDRNAWWPLVDKLGWDAVTLMSLLTDLDRALYDKLPVDSGEADHHD